MAEKKKKKARTRPLKGIHPKTYATQTEFRNCDAPGCPNIISVVDRPKYGPIYCILHSHLDEKT